jgi:hypothetical protein
MLNPTICREIAIKDPTGKFKNPLKSTKIKRQNKMIDCPINNIGLLPHLSNDYPPKKVARICNNPIKQLKIPALYSETISAKILLE